MCTISGLDLLFIGDLSRFYDLREPVGIGLLRVSNFSAYRHRRKLKFTDNLLLALTKNGIDADF